MERTMKERRGGGRGKVFIRIFTSSCGPSPDASSSERCWSYETVHVSARTSLAMRVHWFMRVSACLQRDVATQVGMQFRNARVAHEASPPSTTPLPPPPPPLPLLKAFLQEETEAEGKLAATRKELVGIPLTRLLSSRLLCTSSPLPSFFFFTFPLFAFLSFFSQNHS